MRKQIIEYRNTLKNLLDEIICTKGNILLPYETALEEALSLLVKQSKRDGKCAFIGNGASAAMASHLSTDLWKNGKIKAIAFNDAAGLTCVSNDCGFEYVFQKPVEMFMEKVDVLIAISSSGRSPNIINAVKAAQNKGIKVIALSGFSPKNNLRKLGDINFYVPIDNYGQVEIVHHAICHCLIEMVIKRKK